MDADRLPTAFTDRHTYRRWSATVALRSAPQTCLCSAAVRKNTTKTCNIVNRSPYGRHCTIDVARTSFAGNFSQPMSEFVAQKIFCVTDMSLQNTAKTCSEYRLIADCIHRLPYVHRRSAAIAVRSALRAYFSLQKLVTRADQSPTALSDRRTCDDGQRRSLYDRHHGHVSVVVSATFLQRFCSERC
jgi:hypothetical protein